MSRARQFIQGLTSSWLATIITVFYSLLSVPIALKYLSVDEFGLLMLLQQTGIYLNFIDLGISTATARLLIDHKDKPEESTYSRFVFSGAFVFFIQGLLILLIGWLAAPTIIGLFAISGDHFVVAVYLFRGLSIASAVNAFFRIFLSILYAHKRVDLVVLLGSFGQLLALPIIWIVLSTGMGLKGVVWSFIIPPAMIGVTAIFTVSVLRYFPKYTTWSLPAWPQLREMFILGKDIFLINVGHQVLEASQLMIITRTMGLNAAAIWSVSTKLFTLVYQLIYKVEGTAIVFFSEMMVRGERELLALRFKNIYCITAGLAAVSLACATVVNPFFIAVWAEPKLSWAPYLGLFLSVVVFINCLFKCLVELIIHTKKIRSLRYIFFFEALGFLITAVIAGHYVGFIGILLASIVCAVLFRGIYCYRRVAAYFSIPVSTFIWKWLKRSIFTFIALLPFIVLTDFVIGRLSDPWVRLGASMFWIGIPATFALIFFAIPPETRQEVMSRSGLKFRRR